ncbi:sigma-70 family RNA polymerase sigma factor [Chitinophaga sp. SYP-B3965]|uniref:RNA polymerase sigma factor n=1 Tax=Chitinophaga sp. SYP-B3965 TaxID=2663120 RepID=UPI0012995775|nr:RNA polymerase sigma factor [Chitinophaga sp. SYP-B3965]MRG48925.1 sigma-70 family RNA polymerase sigma factor [Chitinophaga sp. SYP-B3965]
MSTTEFNNLLLSSSDFLYPYAIKLTKSPDEGKDLYQETIVKALTNREKFRSGTNIKAWLYIIMRNTFINHYRRQHKMQLHIQYGLEHVHHHPEEKDERLHEKDLQHAVAKLPMMVRKPFLLYYEGYKYLEIAGILGEPLGTIKSKIYVARRTLRTMVQRY